MDLKSSFPSLSLFTDLDWDAVTSEYGPTSKFVTFPEYLAIKAEAGDCPQHIYELAFFDSAMASIMESEFTFPDTPGLHLNPSACFLSFDYDILSMVKLANEGEVSIIERRNVLCVYVDESGEVLFHELTTPQLETLQNLEQGLPLTSSTTISELAQLGLVIHVS